MATTEIPDLETAATAPRVGSQTSLTALVATILRSARDVVGHTLEIAALESRLAGTALASIVAIGFIVLVLSLSTWGLLLAAGVFALIALGLSPGIALLLAAAATVLLAVLLAFVALRLVRRLSFAATRRVLERIGPKNGNRTAHSIERT